MNYEQALREIDTHIRSTSEPVPYIIETLKATLPEYEGGGEMERKYESNSHEQLMNHVTDVLGELLLRARHEGYKQGQFDAKVESMYGNDVKITEINGDKYVIGIDVAKPTRDQIVEQAKRDVAELLLSRNVEFIVNREKRAVVALRWTRYMYPHNIIESRGIAKCAPDDCFNSHIGKAIALRRALGLDVPSEYLNAPQPTEVKIGDKVEYIRSRKFRSTHTVKVGNIHTVNKDLKISREWDVKIIDDSRDEVSE